MKVLVVGSGIGGLAAAIALRKVGCEVALYERAPELREVGAGISLWANALRALDYLDAGTPVRAAAQPMVRSEMRARDGYKIQAAFVAANFEKRYGQRCSGRSRRATPATPAGGASARGRRPSSRATSASGGAAAGGSASPRCRPTACTGSP